MTSTILIAGVDESGRGPLVGEVVAAAVILSDPHAIPKLKDSKKLTERTRDKLFKIICDQAISWSIASASHQEIDQYNILRATLIAMQRAVAGLKKSPELVLIDGNICPELPYRCEAVVDGDNIFAAISAASVLAKVYRDQKMYELHDLYPQYGFADHKGYATQQHLQALEKYGPLTQHRRSFAPVARLLAPVVAR